MDKIDLADIVQDHIVRTILKIVVFLAFLSFGLLTQRIYQRFRSPESAEFFGNWRVPLGRWILFVLVLTAIVYFAIVLAKDPLARR